MEYLESAYIELGENDDGERCWIWQCDKGGPEYQDPGEPLVLHIQDDTPLGTRVIIEEPFDEEEYYKELDSVNKKKEEEK